MARETIEFGGFRYWTDEEIQSIGYNHLSNAQDLFHSAESCRLCALILDIAQCGFKLRIRQGQQEFTKDVFWELPIKFERRYNYRIPANGRLDLSSLIVSFPFATPGVKFHTEFPYKQFPLLGVLAADGGLLLSQACVIL
jgi:hypothetical protein